MLFALGISNYGDMLAAGALHGLKIVAVAVVAQAVLVAFVALLFWKLPPWRVVMGTAALGWVVATIVKKRAGGGVDRLLLF